MNVPDVAERPGTERFSDRVDAYVRARPHYPDELALQLARALALPPQATVADIGSGTGISCVPFLRTGFTVIGVEPNDAMRAAAERSLQPYSNFRSVKGTAEDTTLAAASVDLVVAGQAFHWFDHARFGAEIRRIAQPSGALALFWNSRRHDASPFMADYNALLLAFCAEYRAKWKGDDVGAKLAPAMAIVFGSRWSEATLPNQQRLDREGLIARIDSDSYAPKPSDPLHAPMIEAALRLFDRHAIDGAVELIYNTRVFYGRPQGESVAADTKPILTPSPSP